MGYTRITSEFKKVEGFSYWAFVLVGMYVDMYLTKSKYFNNWGFFLLTLAGLCLATVLERMQHNKNVRLMISIGKTPVVNVTDEKV